MNQNETMNYTVVSANTLNNLSLRVENFLKKGWRCQGGISSDYIIIDGELSVNYYQVMVKGYDDMFSFLSEGINIALKNLTEPSINPFPDADKKHSPECGTKYRGCSPDCLYHIQPRIDRKSISILETVIISLIKWHVKREHLCIPLENLAGHIIEDLVKQDYFEIDEDILNEEIEVIKSRGYLC